MQCRSCMEVNCAEVVDMGSIASDDGKTLYDLFNDCTQLLANSMDKLPKMLCTTCTRNLQVAYDFRQGARQSDKVFKALFEKQKVEAELDYNATEQMDESEYAVEYLHDPLAEAAAMAVNEPDLVLDIKEELSEELIIRGQYENHTYEKQKNEELYDKQNQEADYGEEHLKEYENEEDGEDRSFDNKGNVICEICNGNFKSRNELRDHIFDQHKSDIICMKCPKVYEFPRELQVHEGIVHGTEPELQCLRCKEFLKRDKLPKHFQMYHGNYYRKYFPKRRQDKLFVEGSAIPCDDCHEEFQTILDLANHIRNHKYDCTLCAMSFRKQPTLRAHLKRIHKRSIRTVNHNVEFDTKYDCSECTSKFVLHKTYRTHLKNQHNKVISPLEEDEVNFFECEFCNLCFKSSSTFYAHKKRQHYSVEEEEEDVNAEEVAENIEESDCSGDWNKTFKCYVCTERFKTKILYKQHMKKAHRINIRIDLANHQGKLYECRTCYSYFTSRSAFYLHKKTKHSEIAETKTSAMDTNSSINGVEQKEVNEVVEKGEFGECIYCHKQIPWNEKRAHERRHVYRMRAQNQKFLCAFCPQEFRAELTLRKHEKRVHFGEKTDVKDCPICQKKLDARYLRTHLANVHTSERKYVCDICGDSFKSQILLHSHKRLHMERNFPCNVCDKKFIRSYDLNIHMRLHTGEEPYQCHICDRRFKIKVRLNYHLQRHAGIKRKCEVCGQEFNHVKQLKIHSYKHTGMPYKCTICNYGCAQRDVFRKHLMRMHGMTMTNEEYNAMFKANTGRNPHVKSLEELQLEEQKMDMEDSN